MVDESAYSFGRWCVVDSGHNPAKMRRAERGKILLQYRTIEISDPLDEISDLFGRKSLPEGRKSFCSAFVVFLRT